MRISVCDLEISNIRSILSALKAINYEANIVNTKNSLRDCDLLIIPGVGSFDSGMEKIIDTEIFKQ